MSKVVSGGKVRVLITLVVALLVVAELLNVSLRKAQAFSAFAPGNLVVYRVGDGSAALSANATPVFLDEYTQAGVLVQSIALPTVATAVSNRALTASGTATSEGLLTRSADGVYLTLSGYNATVGTGSITGSTSATINRVIGRVDNGGTIDTTTALSDAISGGNPRSAVTTNGSDLWISGTSSGGGVRYTTLGATTSTALNTATVTNLRQANIFNGQLYVSSQSGAFRLSTVGTGTPTTGSQTITNLPGYPNATTSPYGFFFADLNPGVAGLDTVYVCDDNAAGGGTGGLQKYSLVGGSWVSNGIISNTGGLRGITGSVSGNTVTLYITTATTLFKLTDTAGYNATNNGSLSSLTTAGLNKNFRGIAFTPTPISTPPSGAGTASPNPVIAGNSTLLTVAVTPGTNPTSTGLGVVADLSSIGGSATQTLFDNGTNGDVISGDNTFSFSATVNAGTTAGGKTLPFTVSESNTSPRSSNGSISLTVNSPAPTNPTGTGSASPNSVFAGGSTTFTVNVTPGANPTSTGLTVTADLSSIGGSANQAFNASGNQFTFTATVTNGTTPGAKSIPFTIKDSLNRQGTGSISLTVKIPAPANNVVISQVYGGGGNTGATLKNDYIELINHGSAPVNLGGWSVQAWVDNPTLGLLGWFSTPLPSFTLQPGQYFLIQEAQGNGGTDNLPTPNAIGTIAVSSGSTKVALVNNTTLLTGCPESDPGAFGIVDLVGYGTTTDCWEGSATAPQLDNVTAIFRRDEGCFDTNDNAADFVSDDPSPRNSSTPTHDCTTLFGYGSANPTSVLVGNNVTLTVHAMPAQNPASTGLTVTADLSSIGGSPAQMFGGSGSVFTFNAPVSLSTTGGFKSLPVSISDGEGRFFNTNIVMSVIPLVPDHITISQLYGGGGNTSATFKNDYVELYNPTASPINVLGWSIQYASAAGSSWTNKQPIGGIIGPGQYLLVELASGGNVGADLPDSQITDGSINMSATTGKVALVKNSDTLTGICPLGADQDIVDFVGYGTGANCHEGNANTPAPSNTTALLRKLSGAQDTDQNGSDFVTGAPNPRQTAPIIELGPWVAGTDPITNGFTVPHDATVTIDFSEPVTVDPNWYNITCASGSHNDATVVSAFNSKTYAITPNTNFLFGEQCTVTLSKTAIHDQDSDDSAADTDTLLADYTWSFTVVGAGQAAPYLPAVHLTMGDPGCGAPSGCAVASTSQPNNFLMMKPTYALSYNRDKGTPNWVSWHLEPAWYGSLARVDTFRPDPAVPSDWYRVQAFDFSGSGFDRGHMTPNADRDNQNRVPINQETYLMSNMLPQSPDNNQGPWAELEGALRAIADQGNELYIVSGPLGVGGSGANGGNTTTLANGHVTVPASTWKVALIIPKADSDDISRVTCSSRALAVLMPNVQGIRNNSWQTYLTTVDNIEQQTGYDFFANLPPAVQACIEAGTDGANPPGTANQSASTSEDNAVTVHLQALQSTNAALTFSIQQGPSSGQLGPIVPTGCANGACTADVQYTPNADFNGADSFTFRATNGTLNSNTSTVSITISEVNDSSSAADDTKTTQEDTPLIFPAGDLTANDSAGPANESTQTLTVTSVTGDANTHGTVILNSGTVSYLPTANYNGPASFTYTMCDNGTTNGLSDSKCASATVNVSVESVNDMPVAMADSAVTNEDNPVTIDAVANDTDDDSDTLNLLSVGTAAHGTVSILSGKAYYTPAANYNGMDGFGYVVSDGHGGQANGSVSITINPVNDAPTANGQTAFTASNTQIGIVLGGSDVETPLPNLTFTVTSGPSHGSLSGSGANLIYTPGLDYAGLDSFKFTVTDTGDGPSGSLTSAEATVSITVNDTVAPVITLNGHSIAIWPPNKSMRTVNVSDLVANASDNFDPTVNLSSVVIASVISDEGTAASGDVVIAGDCKSVELRQNRNGNGDGRVYTITFRARDAAGNMSFVTAKVTVPHNQGGGPAVDSGAAYTINSGCP
jgi:DNA/RNA endonuclease G (NUC1)